MSEIVNSGKTPAPRNPMFKVDVEAGTVRLHCEPLPPRDDPRASMFDSYEWGVQTTLGVSKFLSTVFTSYTTDLATIPTKDWRDEEDAGEEDPSVYSFWVRIHQHQMEPSDWIPAKPEPDYDEYVNNAVDFYTMMKEPYNALGIIIADAIGQKGGALWRVDGDRLDLGGERVREIRTQTGETRLWQIHDMGKFLSQFILLLEWQLVDTVVFQQASWNVLRQKKLISEQQWKPEYKRMLAESQQQ